MTFILAKLSTDFYLTNEWLAEPSTEWLSTSVLDDF